MQRHAHSHQGRKERFGGQRYVIKILSVFLRFSRGDSASIGVALLCPNLDSRRRPTMLTPTTKGAKIRHGNSYVIFSLAIFAFVTYICRKKLRVSRIIVPRKFRNIQILDNAISFYFCRPTLDKMEGETEFFIFIFFFLHLYLI